MDHVKQTDKIADAFEKHFFHYGFKKTNVEEVANELHISKKTVYEHFSGKEQIFEYVISRLADKRIREIREEIKKYRSYREKISWLIDRVLAHRREIDTGDRRHLKDRHENEIARDIFRKAFQNFAEELIIKGFAKGEFNSDMDPTHLTSFIISLVSEGINLQECNPGSHLETDVKYAVFKLLD